MNYFDLHADTPLVLEALNVGFDSDKLNLCSKYFKPLENYVQFAAYCPPSSLSDRESYDRFFKVRDFFLSECKRSGYAVCDSIAALKKSLAEKRPAFILMVEDARLLEGDITRLDELYKCGVRLLTPLWGSKTVIGSSFECDGGLTDFGKEVMHKCAELGIVTDLSHASPESADEIIAIAEKHKMPVIASHSCAYSVNPHPRNLRDTHLRKIAELGGVVGVNFYPPHIKDNSADVNDVIRHLDHYMNIVGEDHVAIGSDFDGMGIFTRDLENIGKIPGFREKLKDHGYTESALEKIFFSNAQRIAEIVLR